MTLSFSQSFAHATAEAGPRVLVLAELGVNHDGDPARALDLLAAAAGAGADAVKLQLFHPERLLSNQAMLAEYQKQAGMEDAAAMLKRLHLPARSMKPLREAAREAGLWFVVTPFSPGDVAELAELDVDAVKIASPDAVNPPLLEAAGKLGKPLLVSTGASQLEELAWVIDFVRRHPAGGALLQCVSSYPTEEEQAALGGIAVLRERAGLPTGYSDHTTALTTGGLAVAAGACLLEKHLTLDRAATGPDHASSLDPIGFTHYVDLAQQAALMLGPLRKTCLPVERDVRQVARQSLAAARDLPAGHVLAEADITVRRPGTGIPALQYALVLGRATTRALPRGDLLLPGDVK